MARQLPLFGPSGQLQGPLKAAFDRLWTAYPPRRPNPRAQAEASFRSLARAHDPARIADAGAAFAEEMRKLGTDPAFVPHLATWLRQQRFLDYPPFTTAAVSPPAIAAPDQVDHPWWPAFRDRGVTPAEFRSWIAPLTLVAVTEHQAALIEAGTRFRANWVRHHYAGTLAKALGVQRVEIVDQVRP